MVQARVGAGRARERRMWSMRREVEDGGGCSSDDNILQGRGSRFAVTLNSSPISGQGPLVFAAVGEIGVRWKALDEEAKKPYEAQAAADKARHATEMRQHIMRLPLLYTLLLVAPSASATTCSAPLCSAPFTCVHNANHAEAATDADCSPCSPPTSQGWWPCNVDGLCLCKTAAPSPLSPPPPPVACIYNTSHAQGATHADCKPCGPPTLQGWWPCNVAGLCDCAPGNLAAAAGAKIMRRGLHTV